jgi:hypothetical protein
VRELWVVAGRRAGKDSIAAGIATVVALADYQPFLRTGERATVMCLASDRQQAGIVHRYIAGYFRELPNLAALVLRETEDTIELANAVDILIASNNLRAPRGRTIAVAILDEVAYWRGADSASPDSETFAAIQPATLTIPDSLIIGISSPYRRSGLLFQKWAKHYGKPDDDVLVVRGSSKTFNPTLPDAVIEARLAADPEAGGAEYLAEWRSDIGDFLDLELVESAVDRGIAARPPQPGAEYSMFIDASGGRGSAFAAAVAHTEAERVLIDCVYEKLAPFDPQEAVKDVAALARQYRVGTLRGDRYAAEWVTEAFGSEGLVYVNSDKDKSALFLEALPLFSTGRIALPDNQRLVHQLTNLERITTKSGRDKVSCPSGGSDDLANAVAGAAVNAVADGPALVRGTSVFAQAIPTPKRAQVIFSATAIGQDGLIATAFFAVNRRDAGWISDECVLIDATLEPLMLDTAPKIFQKLSEHRAMFTKGNTARRAFYPGVLEGAFASAIAGYAEVAIAAHISGAFSGQVEMDIEPYDETPRADLPALAVQFSLLQNSGRFKVTLDAVAKSRTIPLAAALTFRPGERIEDSSLRVALLEGVKIGLIL